MGPFNSSRSLNSCLRSIALLWILLHHHWIGSHGKCHVVLALAPTSKHTTGGVVTRQIRRGKARTFKILSLGTDYEIRLCPSPLIGGPKWLPLHVKVILCDNTNKNHCQQQQGQQDDDDDYLSWWDFVPCNATDKAVLAKLTALQSVPGDIRSSTATERATANAKTTTETTAMLMIQKAGEFCESYPHELHLIKNNCWTFAFRLAFFLANVHREVVAKD